MPRTPGWAGRVTACGLLLLVTGCGSGTVDPHPADPSSGTATGSTAPGSTSGPPADAELFPLTISRTGGIAGVQDSVVVTATGEATLTTREGRGTCTVPAASMDQLREAAAVSRTATTRTLPPTPDVADGFVVTVTSPGGSASLTDPQLAGSAAVVGQLLSAAQAPPAAGSPCF